MKVVVTRACTRASQELALPLVLNSSGQALRVTRFSPNHETGPQPSRFGICLTWNREYTGTCDLPGPHIACTSSACLCSICRRKLCHTFRTESPHWLRRWEKKEGKVKLKKKNSSSSSSSSSQPTKLTTEKTRNSKKLILKTLHKKDKKWNKERTRNQYHKETDKQTNKQTVQVGKASRIRKTAWVWQRDGIKMFQETKKEKLTVSLLLRTTVGHLLQGDRYPHELQVAVAIPHQQFCSLRNVLTGLVPDGAVRLQVRQRKLT